MYSRPHDSTLCGYLVLEVSTAPGSPVATSSAWVASTAAEGDAGELVPAPLTLFPDEGDTGPLGFTIVGPLMSPRRPSRPRSGRK